MYSVRATAVAGAVENVRVAVVVVGLVVDLGAGVGAGASGVAVYGGGGDARLRGGSPALDATCFCVNDVDGGADDAGTYLDDGAGNGGIVVADVSDSDLAEDAKD